MHKTGGSDAINRCVSTMPENLFGATMANVNKTYQTMKIIRNRLIPSLAGLLLAAATITSAQTAVPAPTGDLTVRSAGDKEFTLGGNGASNRNFDESFGGVNFSYGWYTTPTQLLSIRQSVNYSNPDVGGQNWNGSTRVAFDQHLTAHGAFRPFVGVNAGGVYGDRVRETFVAGLEAGAKFYVQPRTFIYAIVEYGWFFRRARSVDDTFDDGQFNWGVGVGFNF
jgi:hypothetical protein